MDMSISIKVVGCTEHMNSNLKEIFIVWYADDF